MTEAREMTPLELMEAYLNAKQAFETVKHYPQLAVDRMKAALPPKTCLCGRGRTNWIHQLGGSTYSRCKDEASFPERCFHHIFGTATKSAMPYAGLRE